jgi:hypothetical protein
MSKRQIESPAQRTRATLRKHVGELVEHTIEAARYNDHGHVAGQQGRALMPKSNAHLQSVARLPQNICEGFGADDPEQRDYGVIDQNS